VLCERLAVRFDGAGPMAPLHREIEHVERWSVRAHIERAKAFSMIF
jgi:hypothetical protein